MLKYIPKIKPRKKLEDKIKELEEEIKKLKEKEAMYIKIEAEKNKLEKELSSLKEIMKQSQINQIKDLYVNNKKLQIQQAKQEINELFEKALFLAENSLERDKFGVICPSHRILGWYHYIKLDMTDDQAMIDQLMMKTEKIVASCRPKAHIEGGKIVYGIECIYAERFIKMGEIPLPEHLRDLKSIRDRYSY
jgi:predicted nuclease with TOPRIM domain